MIYIKQLGTLAFATRLRLLTDKFIQDAVKIYKSLNIDFEPRWFTVFYLLHQRSPLSISEITAELGYTQPAVTQIVNILMKKKLVKIISHRQDSRKKILELSKKGEDMVPVLIPVWNGFSGAIEELFREINCNMLVDIEKIENALEQKDMQTRVNEIIRLNKNQQS